MWCVLQVITIRSLYIIFRSLLPLYFHFSYQISSSSIRTDHIRRNVWVYNQTTATGFEFNSIDCFRITTICVGVCVSVYNLFFPLPSEHYVYYDPNMNCFPYYDSSFAFDALSPFRSASSYMKSVVTFDHLIRKILNFSIIIERLRTEGIMVQHPTTSFPIHKLGYNGLRGSSRTCCCKHK